MELVLTNTNVMPPLGVSVLRCVRLLRVFKVTKWATSLVHDIVTPRTALHCIAAATTPTNLNRPRHASPTPCLSSTPVAGSFAFSIRIVYGEIGHPSSTDDVLALWQSRCSGRIVHIWLLNHFPSLLQSYVAPATKRRLLDRSESDYPCRVRWKTLSDLFISLTTGLSFFFQNRVTSYQ